MARRREPATELDEAKTALQHDDIRATLKHAERARRLFLEREDLAGLKSVLAFLATVPSDQQSDRVTYATRQNLRFVGRGVALKEGGPYEDPFPARSTSTPDPPVTRRELATRIAWLVGGFALIGVLGWSIVTPRVTQWFRCNQGNVGAPSISPDGTRIVFARCEHAGVRLVVTRIDGSNPTVMSNLGEAQMPSWSPDGRSVLYEDSNNDYRLTTLATGRSRVLSPDGTDFGAALAPDGRTIAYTHGTVPGFLDDYVLKSSLRVRTADGYVTHLPVDALGPGTPSWSPDGSKLAFAGRMVSTQSAETGLD